MTETPQFLILARVLRPHGVRGDLRVQMITNFPERMSKLESIYFSSDPEATRNLTQQQVAWTRPDKSDYWFIHLQDIDDRDAADRFRNQYLLVPVENAVPLEADEVYLFQVMGLEVHTLEGENLGNVVDIIETGANDVYVVRGEAYGEILIPSIAGVIRNIDVEGGVMTVQLPAGLLSDE